MSFAGIATKVNWNNVYLGVVGGSVVVSFLHFALNNSKLIDSVPLHYDYLGRPGNYVDKAYFFLYPATTAVCAAMGYGLRAGASVPIRASDQLPARIVLATSLVILVGCQFFASKISRGEAQKIPTECILGALSIVGSCGLYSLLNGALNR